jgi:hypothetical protein
MMTLVLPQLELTSSPLLQAATDEHFFNLWDYEKDGDYPHCRAVKEEIESLVSEIERSNSSEALFVAAEEDRPLMQGNSFRGPTPYSRKEGRDQSHFDNSRRSSPSIGGR